MPTATGEFLLGKTQRSILYLFMGSTCSTVQVVERSGRYGGGESDGAGVSGARTLESLVSAATTQGTDAAEPRDPPSMRIQVTNVRENEAVPHPLVMLEGWIENMPTKYNNNRNSNDTCAYIQAYFKERDSLSSNNNNNNSSRRGGLCWPVVPRTGHFKAFVLLPKPGAYTIHLQIASVTFVLNIRFAQLPTKYFVRFHYQKPYDSNQGFDAPAEIDSSDSAAIDRIKLNALVLQTAFAELLQQAGGHRMTFALELGDDGFPVVHLLRSQYSTAHARAMEDDELLRRLRQDVIQTETRSVVNRNSSSGSSSHNEDNRSSQQQLCFKHVVILGGAHFDRHTREIFGHKELADGNLVVFGSCGLHTWPRALEELTACCLNNTRFLPQVFLRDCAGRGSYWAKYAFAISRLLQLLGNSFGLAYQREGIMSAGFHQLNRLIAVFEPTALVHVSTFSHPIGDGRFSLLDHSALVAVDAESADEDEELIVYLDDISLDALAVKYTHDTSQTAHLRNSISSTNGTHRISDTLSPCTTSFTKRASAHICTISSAHTTRRRARSSTRARRRRLAAAPRILQATGEAGQFVLINSVRGAQMMTIGGLKGTSICERVLINKQTARAALGVPVRDLHVRAQERLERDLRDHFGGLLEVRADGAGVRSPCLARLSSSVAARRILKMADMALFKLFGFSLRHSAGGFIPHFPNSTAMERQEDESGEVDVRVRVEIANLRENERLLYPLVLVEGYVVVSDDEPAVTFIDAGLAPPAHSSESTSTTTTTTSALSWPVVLETGHFKAFVLLPRPGKHEIQLRVRGSLMRVLTIRYARPVTKHFARFHYQQAPNAIRGFDAPPGVDNSDDAALQRVRLGALLTQTCIAEMFHKQELPRATIALEFDDSAECQMPLANLLVTPADSIYDTLDAQTALARQRGVALKHFVHVGSNHYNPETREVPDHRAHMYGNSYLFSAGTLHTWPMSLSELTRCCLDNTQIDPNILSDDSVDRGSYWANFATGFGVFMHLFFRSTSVQDDGDGMFGRGFDNTNRLLSVYEPTYASSEPAFVDLSSQEGSENVAPFELNYEVLEAVGGDVEGAYVNETTLLALNEVCPFIKSGSKLSQARKDAAAAA